ncbi:MAG: hypothetical protein N2644_03700 [Candidatus Sumerlaea chitinivorans]|nr:hypothetical protein [Candidatus Sumerlaea chitinivorans]
MGNTDHRHHQKNDEQHHGGPHPSGYEPRDANTRAIFKAVVYLTLGTAAIVYLLWILFVQLHGPEEKPRLLPPPVAKQPDQLPPEPRLQLSPRQEMEAMRAAEDRILNAYGWVDQAQGKVRIPIARAMQLTLERGLPTRPMPPTENRDQATSRAADSASGRFVERKVF